MTRTELEAIAQRQAELVVELLGGEPWLDKSGLAEFFACSTRTVENWMQAGLPSVIIAGRAKFRASEASGWLTEHGHLTAEPNGARMNQSNSDANGRHRVNGPPPAKGR